MSSQSVPPTAYRIKEVRRIGSTRPGEELPPPVNAEIAFAGRSNVGKSSLINALVNRKRLVRTSSKPGCTRGIDIYGAVLDPSAAIDLIDLPGYGYAQRSKAERQRWGALIERFVESRAGLRVLVLIVDVRRGPEPDDLQLLQYARGLEKEIVVVATKLDKLPRNQRKVSVAKLRSKLHLPVYGFSALTGEGKEQLWGALLAKARIA